MTKCYDIEWEKEEDVKELKKLLEKTSRLLNDCRFEIVVLAPGRRLTILDRIETLQKEVKLVLSESRDN